MVSHEALQYGADAIGLIAFTIAVAVLVGLDRTRPSALLAAATFLNGMAVATAPVYLDAVNPQHPQLLARMQGVFEAAAIITYACYMLGVLASSSLTERRAKLVRACAWVAVALGCWHAFASAAWPVQRLNDYELSLSSAAVHTGGFWLFAVFWLVAIVPYGVGWGVLGRGGLDPAEARRAHTAAAASVFVIAATAMPAQATPVLLAVWLGFGIYGQLQYGSARAQRAVFLSRFLSPRVTELVSTGGFAEAMAPHHADITVVAADLRSFTAYSESVPSSTVVELLVEYYDAVGAAVAKHGAAITNYAGDGILILVGAPIADLDHAVHGVELAHDLLGATEQVLARYRSDAGGLALGVGVATGTVTVGAIQAQTRMEYTAVGSAVNLAARLAAAASGGEVLLAATTAQRSGVRALDRGKRQIKGFSAPQQVYAADRSVLQA